MLGIQNQGFLSLETLGVREGARRTSRSVLDVKRPIESLCFGNYGLKGSVFVMRLIIGGRSGHSFRSGPWISSAAIKGGCSKSPL